MGPSVCGWGTSVCGWGTSVELWAAVALSFSLMAISRLDPQGERWRCLASSRQEPPTTQHRLPLDPGSSWKTSRAPRREKGRWRGQVGAGKAGAILTLGARRSLSTSLPYGGTDRYGATGRSHHPQDLRSLRLVLGKSHCCWSTWGTTGATLEGKQSLSRAGPGVQRGQCGLRCTPTAFLVALRGRVTP